MTLPSYPATGVSGMPSVAAASPDPKTLTVPAQELSKARELVHQLGSEQFADREKAELELAKMGRLARPALLEGVNTDPNPEVRSRCSDLLPKATALDLKARIEVFLEYEASASRERRAHDHAEARRPEERKGAPDPVVVGEPKVPAEPPTLQRGWTVGVEPTGRSR